MKPLFSLVGSLTLLAALALPARAETLVSDSGLTRIYGYQFTHEPGDVIDYTTSVGGRKYNGVINVTQVGNSFVKGWFSDRSPSGDFGCTGQITVQFVGNNRYVSIWQTQGSYAPYVACPEAGTTFRLGMTAYP